MRSVDQLINLTEPAWPELEAELRACPGAEVLPIEPDAGRACLHAIQVTTRSRLGAVALHCGGLVFDHGWLRVYGGGCNDRGLASLATVNGVVGGEQGVLPSFAVGHDVLGGRFDLFGPDSEYPGEVCYFAPDTLEWESLEMGYGAWLSWLATGATAQFYESMRWPGWQEEVAALRLDQGLTVYPFLCTAEAMADLAATTRSPAPIQQVIDFQAHLASELVVRVTE